MTHAHMALVISTDLDSPGDEVQDLETLKGMLESMRDMVEGYTPYHAYLDLKYDDEVRKHLDDLD